MDDDRSAEAGLQLLLLPGVFLSIVLIGWENLRGKLGLLALLSFLGGNLSLFFSSVLGLILQVEADGLLEVDLDGAALIWSLEGVVDLTIDLGSVERTITVIEGPGHTTGVESLLEGCLRLIPQIIASQTVLGPGRQLQLESESKDGVHVLEEVEHVLDLTGDLLGRAENVTVILLEASNSDKSAKGTRDLISVKHAKISVTKRQVTIAVHTMFEHDAVRWAVHRLKTEAGTL